MLFISHVELRLSMKTDVFVHSLLVHTRAFHHSDENQWILIFCQMSEKDVYSGGK